MATVVDGLLAETVQVPAVVVPGAVQHRGTGRRLMHEAERIARNAGKDKMVIIAGVGVRDYYIARLGYMHDREYVSKQLTLEN